MGDCAPRFRSRDVDDLEVRLRYLLAHPEVVASFEAMTKERISRRFSWETVVDDIEQTYLEVDARRYTARAETPIELPA